MRYFQRNRQVSYGEPIGILVIENYVPFVPGDTANASSYSFPVRFERLHGFTPERLFDHDTSMVDDAIAAGQRLVDEGVQAVTGDCGFLAIYQDRIGEALGVPVFLSSLLQLDFIARMLPPSQSVGVVTANRTALDQSVLSAVTSVPDHRMIIAGLENSPHFVSAVFDESGELDTDLVEAEVLEVTDEVLQRAREAGTPVGALLLECSLLPPYAAAVQARAGVPVFDYNTMINYVFSAVVRRRFDGFM
jgi:hypothetical protein